jgi:hypothetical protein
MIRLGAIKESHVIQIKLNLLVSKEIFLPRFFFIDRHNE